MLAAWIGRTTLTTAVHTPPDQFSVLRLKPTFAVLAVLAEMVAHETYLTLTSQTSVNGIKCTVMPAYWPTLDQDEWPPDTPVPGTIEKWVNVNNGFAWSDGWTIDNLSELLIPDFKFTIISNATGSVVKRRGATHPALGNAVGQQQPKEKVEVAYKIGVQSFTQVWEVETENISTDWRTEPRTKPSLKIDPSTVPDITSMYLNATCVMTIVDKQVAFVNKRLSGVVTSVDRTNKFTTKGELIRVRGYVLTIALHAPPERDA
jgi:hypothetical protein